MKQEREAFQRSNDLIIRASHGIAAFKAQGDRKKLNEHTEKMRRLNESKKNRAQAQFGLPLLSTLSSAWHRVGRRGGQEDDLHHGVH